MTNARLATLLVFALLAAAAVPYVFHHPRLGQVALLWVGLALLAFGLTIGAVYAVVARHQPDGATGADYRHARQLFVVIFGALLVVAVVREFLIPESFGEHGYYRAGAVPEARQRQPRFLGKKACVSCHDREVRLHAKDAHARVQCEDCHGPGRRHVELAREAAGKGTKSLPDAARLQRPKSKAWCLTCHQRLAARPGPFAQIDWREHYAFVGVKDKETECIRCHDPHEPVYMDRDLRTARLHPVVHRCRDCHIGKARDRSTPRPAGHPAIFDCSYCHKKTAADFAERSHSEVRCTTCHLFFKESEFAGRILRDADPRFCLLCHREADFRSDDAPPGISWPGHREDMADGPEDNNKVCIDCHREMIHLVFKGDK